VAEVWGRVVALQANYCSVVPDPPVPDAPRSDPQLPQRLLCTRRTRLDHAGLQVCVGDRVRLEGIDVAAGRAAVAALAPRANLLQRPPVANVSRVVVVASLADPPLDPAQLSRFLLSAEACGGAVELVLSKADLVPPAQRLLWTESLADWGYDARAVSSRTGEGLDALASSLMAAGGGILVLCGPSGAGKSSLLNALCADLALRVAPVSGRLRRGRHTTRHVELFPLAPGTLLADTPGFNRPELPAEPAELAWLFPELRRQLASGSCRFRNCRHLGDPGCVAGIDWPRFLHYRQALEELEQAAAASRSRGGGLSRRGRAD
jgi:ribosome biogenesis GTPase